MTATQQQLFAVRVLIAGKDYNAADREDLEAVGARRYWSDPNDAQAWLEANVADNVPAVVVPYEGGVGEDPDWLAMPGTIGAQICSVVPADAQAWFRHPNLRGSEAVEWWAWEQSTEVGRAVVLVLAAAWKLTEQLEDVQPDEINRIWKAVGDQCLTFAFG